MDVWNGQNGGGDIGNQVQVPRSKLLDFTHPVHCPINSFFNLDPRVSYLKSSAKTGERVGFNGNCFRLLKVEKKEKSFREKGNYLSMYTSIYLSIRQISMYK